MIYGRYTYNKIKYRGDAIIYTTPDINRAFYHYQAF